jgi:cytochrome c oxidase subunit 4
MMSEESHKIITIPWMFIVYIALMILLGSTILAAHFTIGALGLLIALIIAATKAFLVILYYMHIRVESRTTWIFVGAGFIWLTIMICLTAGDYVTRPWLARTDEVNPHESMIIPPPPGMRRQPPQSPTIIPFQNR